MVEGVATALQLQISAHHVFQTWAHQWMRIVRKDPVTRDYAALVCTAILIAFQQELNRPPTALEWVDAFKLFSRMQVSVDMVRDYLKTQQMHASPEKTPNHWLSLLKLYGDPAEVLRHWTRNVARAFLWPVALPETPHDWTDPSTVATALQDAQNALTPVSCWRKLWRWWKRR